MRTVLAVMIVLFAPAAWAVGQSSSLYKASLARRAAVSAATTRPTANGALRVNAGTTRRPNRPRNEALARFSLTAVTPPEPTVIGVHDHVGVIVRYRYRSKIDAKMKQESEWDLSAKLEAWFRIHDRRLQQQAFRGGKPEVKFKNTNDLENKSKADRRDILETRLMGEVLDVKPNGNLFIVASYTIGTGEDRQRLVLTGDVNRKDIGPDGNVTSDKIANLYIDMNPEGTVADTIKRGWFKEALDAFKPF